VSIININQSAHISRTDHLCQSRPSSPPRSPQPLPSALHHALTAPQHPQPPHHIIHKLYRPVENGATILDHRLHLRRNLRSPRRLRCPRPQEAHCGPRETTELGHCCAVSGAYPVPETNFSLPAIFYLGGLESTSSILQFAYTIYIIQLLIGW
jgi:hypothetical protein